MTEPPAGSRPAPHLSPGGLGILVMATVVSIAAGTPVAFAVSGRSLPLGPADLLVFLLLATLPLWFRRVPPPSTFVMCAVLFVLWAWVSAVYWSIDFRRSVLSAKGLLEGVVVYLAAWHAAEEGEAHIFPSAVRLLNTILVVQMALVFWRLVTGSAQGFYGLKDLIQTPLGGSNFLAIFVEFGLLYELVSRRRWWVAFAALDGAGILLTFSRGAVLATAGVLGLTSIVVLAVRGQRKVSLVAAGALLTFGAALALTPALQLLVQAFAIVGRTAVNRLELWQDAWQAAAWRPLTGVGYAAYEAIGTQREAHSLPLALLAETGVPGLALFTLAVLGAAGRVTRAAADPRTGARRAEALGVTAGLAVVLVHSLIEPFFSGFGLVWAAAVFAWIMGPWSAQPRPGVLLSRDAVPAAIARPS